MDPTDRGRSRLGSIVALSLLFSFVAAVHSTPAHAAWSQPGFLRSIGGRGEARVYAWGIQWNPISNEIAVGDYWNYKVRRYDLSGEELGAFYRSPSLRQGAPYSLAIDPRNGDIWVPEISDSKARGYLAHYDSLGNYLGDIQIEARYYAWIHIDSSGLLYVADSHYWNNAGDPPKIRVYDLTGHLIRSWGTYGSGPGQMGIIHGIETDAAGNVYAADALNKNIHVYSATGTWLRDFGSAGTGVGQFTNDLRGLAVDKINGWVYVVDAEAGEIEKFDLAGNPLDHWGSVGQGPGQFADGGRQVTVDGAGGVWVADYGNFRLFHYGSSGNLIATYPDPAAPPPPGGFAQVRDVALDLPSGEVWGADSWNNRFQKFASDGTFLATWGHRNSDPPYGLDYPRGIGIDPASGNVWVVSTRDHFIRVYDDSGNYLMQVGSGIDSRAPGSFRWPMDVEFYGGKAFVSDYVSSRVKILDAITGNELSYISLSNSGVAVDPATGNIYVVSWANDRVTEYDPSGSVVIRTFGSRGSGNGQFENPWDIDIVGDTIYVTDAVLARVQAFSLTGTFLGKWGAKGTGAFQFNNPSGISHDSLGNIYVADAGNDRISVFSHSIPLPSGDTVKPTATLDSPTSGQALPPTTVVIAGTASDDVGVAKVEVAVRDNSTNQWWNAKDSVWSATKVWNLSARVSSDPLTGSYAFYFVGMDYDAEYFAQSKAIDTSENKMTTFPSVTFSTTSSAPDVGPPSTTFDFPTLDQEVPAGNVAIHGNAIDDAAGVASAQIAIKDRDTNLWWDPATGNWGSLQWISTTLTDPGDLYAEWSYDWAGGVPGGSYYVQARSTDSLGNVDESTPFTRFTIGS